MFVSYSFVLFLWAIHFFKSGEEKSQHQDGVGISFLTKLCKNVGIALRASFAATFQVYCGPY